jgi:hypothetical protein
MLTKVVLAGFRPSHARMMRTGVFILSIAHGLYAISGGCRFWAGHAEVNARELVLRPTPNESFWESCMSELDETLRGAVEASRGTKLLWTINAGRLTVIAPNGPEFSFVKLPSSASLGDRLVELHLHQINESLD